MPWCPKCKNEYKKGYEVCADCGCKLMDSLGPEMVAYFGTEDEADRIVEYLEENGIDYAYTRYNSKDGQYEVLIQESRKEEIRGFMRTYFTKIAPVEIPDPSEMEIQTYDEPPVMTPRYKDPSERADEYKSGAQTLLLVGIVGAILLVLLDMGIVPLALSNESKILINVVMGGMFIVFIALGINSVKTYKKLLKQSEEDENLENDIVDWFGKSVTIDMIASNENKRDSEEALYFGRIKKIKEIVSAQYKDLDLSFLEYISDKLYNNLFN